jgi:hypothetical protein
MMVSQLRSQSPKSQEEKLKFKKKSLTTLSKPTKQELNLLKLKPMPFMSLRPSKTNLES